MIAASGGERGLGLGLRKCRFSFRRVRAATRRRTAVRRRRACHGMIPDGRDLYRVPNRFQTKRRLYYTHLITMGHNRSDTVVVG